GDRWSTPRTTCRYAVSTAFSGVPGRPSGACRIQSALVVDPPDVAVAGERRVRRRGVGLGGGEDTEEVLAEDLQDLVVLVATLHELEGDLRQALDAAETVGDRVDAVEVGAEADVIDPRDLHDVIDVVGDDRDRHLRQRSAVGLQL